MSRSFLHLISRLSATLLLVFLISAAFTTDVHAAGSDDDGIIEAGEIINDDVFLDGTNVRMDGDINGNLFAAGASITINGTVSGDAFLFSREVIVGENAVIEGNLFSGAQSLRIEGQVNGSLAVGASSMVLSGSTISGNVYYGGFNLETASDTFIGVDLFAGSYQMILNGEVGRDVAAAVAAVEINGTVNRNVTLEMGDREPNPLQFPAPPGVDETLQPGLRVGAAAVIGGDLKYTNPTDQSGRIQAEPGGQIIYQTPVPGGQAEPQSVPAQTNPLWLAFSTAWGLFMNFWKHFFSLIIVGTLVVLVFPRLLKRAVTSLKTQPLGSAGFGILTLILGYAAILVLVLVIVAVSILLSILSGRAENSYFRIRHDRTGFSQYDLYDAGFVWQQNCSCQPGRNMGSHKTCAGITCT